MDAHHLFHEVGLAIHVGPPGGHGDLHPLARAGDDEAEARQDLAALLRGDLEARQALHLREGEVDDLGRVAGIAESHPPSPPCRRRAPAPVQVARSRPGTMYSGSMPRSKR